MRWRSQRPLTAAHEFGQIRQHTRGRRARGRRVERTSRRCGRHSGISVRHVASDLYDDTRCNRTLILRPMGGWAWLGFGLSAGGTQTYPASPAPRRLRDPETRRGVGHAMQQHVVLHCPGVSQQNCNQI